MGREGQPWTWLCEEVINLWRQRKFARSDDGVFYVTDRLGLLRSTDAGCTWVPVTGEISGRYLQDLVADPVDPHTVWAVSSDNLGDSGTVSEGILWVSRDSGASFTRVYTRQRLFDALAIAPSNPQVIYLATLDTSAANPMLLRSADGGATWSDLPIALTIDGEIPRGLQLQAVDPRSPDVVYVRGAATVTTASGPVARQALFRSTDGGTTLSMVWKMDAQPSSSTGTPRGINGTAVDGARGWVYVATINGLLRAKDDDGSGKPAAQLTLTPLAGLSQSQCVDVDQASGAVWACASDFSPDFAALAKSVAGGEAFQSVLKFEDTKSVADCAPSTPVGAQCPGYFRMYGEQLGIPSLQPDMSTMEPGGGGGCGCEVGGHERRSALLLGVAAAALALVMALARRRAR